MPRSSAFGSVIRHSCLGIVCLLALAAPVHAQIYSWHDSSGHLVLSDRPADTVEHTYAVPLTTSMRATQPVAAPASGRYDELIAEQARLNAVRSDLVRAVVQVESAFNPNAASPKGALGLMQLMPATIQHYNVRDPFNPAENVRAGVAYLRRLLDRYENNEQLALAAYNAGPGAVDRHGSSVPPFPETQQYVTRVRGLAGTAAPAPARGTTIYRSTDFVDGREVPKFSNTRPAGPYEVVERRTGGATK